jgi:predicted PurR-regulated permease PerM
VGPVVETALVVAVLALGRPVLVPVALAFYLAFVLTPPAEGLERLGMPRALSLMTITAGVFSGLAVVGSVLVSQVAELARQMKTYAGQMRDKLASLRSAREGVLHDLGNAVSELGRGLDSETFKLEDATPVRVVSNGLSDVERIEQSVSPFLHPIGVSIAVVVIALFVLGHREDLRGRLIRLAGTQNVTVATRTMAEAVNRVSRFLLTQLCINAGFAAVIATGLYFIGIPYAVLWGVLAGLLRFVPFVGSTLAAALPILVAFAIFPGLRHVALTAGLFLVVDLVTANVVEPVVLGKRAGVSAVALLISALFWTWLWGPVGLVLATPLTVCAAVVGRHVPRLAFLTVLLGDEPGLSGSVEFYQRILAKATRDAHSMARSRVQTTSLVETLEELVIPALGLMAIDQNQQTINSSTAERVVKDLREIVGRLPSPATAEPDRAHASIVVGVPAESEADTLLLEMLALTLAEQKGLLVTLERADRERLVAQALERRPAVVCIAALPPGGSANARFLCRRLRAALPEARLVVLRPESVNPRSQESAARLREAGANGVVYGLRDASKLLMEMTASAHHVEKQGRLGSPADGLPL